tara:strand:- start:1467 stop:1655 length:189 start_codon:yes stop_codon:yes gene_type:complete
MTTPKEWNTSKPPNEILVEVEYDDKIIKVKAFYGRDGYRPHWQNEDESISWSVNAFKRWREI